MNARKAELVARLDAQRPLLSRHYRGIKRSANVGRRLQRNAQEHPSIWMAAAASFGWLLSRVPARKKKVFVDRVGDKKVRRGFLTVLFLGLLKILGDVAKPTIVAFASKKIADSLALTSKVQERALQRKR